MKQIENIQEEVDRIFNSLPPERRYLILFLHRVQQKLGYIPEEALLRSAEYFSASPAEVYGVVTFYSGFRLSPSCQHEIVICQGTACHVRGAQAIKEELSRILEITPGEANSGKNIALRTVNCLGCCALAPVVVVDGEYQARVNLKDLKKIVEKFSKKSR